MSVVGGAKAEVISDHRKQPVMTLNGNYKAAQALLNVPVKVKNYQSFKPLIFTRKNTT
jgi:hypothetical protein